MIRLIRLLCCSALLLVGAQPLPEPPAGGLSENASATMAYLDPATGRLAVPPPAVQVRWAEAGAREHAAAKGPALRERTGRSAAGGFEVVLAPRFASRVVATVSAEGLLATDCLPAAADLSEAHRP